MKVWWCEEHDSKAATPILTSIGIPIGMCQQYSLTPSEGQNRCRFVEMQLVLADARVVSGEAIVIEKVGGQWPDWAERFVAPHSLDDFLEAQEPPKDPWDYDP